MNSGKTNLSRKISPVFQEGLAQNTNTMAGGVPKKPVRKPGSIDTTHQKNHSKNSRVTPREAAEYLNYK